MIVALLKLVAGIGYKVGGWAYVLDDMGSGFVTYFAHSAGDRGGVATPAPDDEGHA